MYASTAGCAAPYEGDVQVETSVGAVDATEAEAELEAVADTDGAAVLEEAPQAQVNATVATSMTANGAMRDKVGPPHGPVVQTPFSAMRTDVNTLDKIIF